MLPQLTPGLPGLPHNPKRSATAERNAKARAIRSETVAMSKNLLFIGLCSKSGALLRCLTKKFSSGAGCEDFMPRKAVMPAPSAATAGSACPWLVEHHRTTSHPRRQPRVGQPCRGQACADTPAAPRRAGTRRQRPGGARPRRSAVRSPPAASGSAPR